MIGRSSGHRDGVEIVETYAAVVAAVTEAVSDRSEADLSRPTRTEWTVRELLWHQTFDAIRALAAFATPVGSDEGEPDVDAVSYWRPFTPDQGDGGAAHAAFIRAQAAAFRAGEGVVDFWRVTGPAAAHAAAAADPAARVTTQGHVLAVPDFVSTLVVEATVHLLDLTGDLPDAPAPPPAALAETRRVLEAIEGGPLPAEWDDTEAVLRGTGRLPGWRALLG